MCRRQCIPLVSVGIFSTYVATCHSMLYQCILECLTFLLLASGRHNLNFLKNEYHIYINGCVVTLRAFKNPCRPGWRIFSQPAVCKGLSDVIYYSDLYEMLTILNDIILLRPLSSILPGLGILLKYQKGRTTLEMLRQTCEVALWSFTMFINQSHF
jgi:hypothetical protein